MKPNIITECYENCEIFITGGTGVVGKALIEKLLRSCSVRRIYILIRNKRNLSVEQRLEKIRSDKIFRVLRSVKPRELDKLVAIPGDAALPNLGITPAYAEIIQNVSVFFHCAATVRFDEPLHIALRLNVGGTYEALKVAETLKQLKIFLHVSTFYSNPYLTYVEPKIYSPPMDWKLCLKLLDSHGSSDMLDILTRKLTMGFPNTYTFTKNLAENLVNEFSGRLPVAIFRPSIVIFALSEPEPGYPPGFMGASGLFAAVAAGILKTVYLHPGTFFDLTPLDICTNTQLYYSAKAALDYKAGKFSEAPVYLCSAAKVTKHTFRQIVNIPEKHKQWDDAAVLKSLLTPGCHYTGCRFVYLYLVFTKQIIPALLIDMLLMAFGRAPALMGIARKGFHALEVMKPFMFNSYDSPGYNDWDIMAADVANTEFDFVKYLKKTSQESGLRESSCHMAHKLREVLFNETADSLPKAKRILLIKKIIHNVIRIILAYYILLASYGWISNYINNIHVPRYFRNFT